MDKKDKDDRSWLHEQLPDIYKNYTSEDWAWARSVVDNLNANVLEKKRKREQESQDKLKGSPPRP